MCRNEIDKSIVVSVIIPVRDEIRYIESCLQSILHGDWPNNRLEIIVVDGMSSDGSRDVVCRMARDHSEVRLMENERRSTPNALNLGVATSRGDIIVRMDAHAVYATDYISCCVQRLIESGADNVGGVCITLPGAETAIAHAIALGLSHRFGVGRSRFRIGVSRATWVDTVPFGCWRRTVFERIGLFDTDLLGGEDDEFNARLRRCGGRIMLDPDIRSLYFARPYLSQFSGMLFQYGYCKPFASYKIGRITSGRQLVPVLFVIMIAFLALLGIARPAAWFALGVLLGLHLTIGLIIGLWRQPSRGVRTAFLLPLVFLVGHLSYGWGYLLGLLGLVVSGRPILRAKVTR